MVGPHILCEHCIFENSAGEVKLIPQVNKVVKKFQQFEQLYRNKNYFIIHSDFYYLKPGAICFVNGRKIDSAVILKTGSRVILGKNHVFRFNHPDQGNQNESLSMPNISYYNIAISNLVYYTKSTI